MIELTNISKYYQMGDETVHALQDVNLKIDDGDYVAIIGPSGSGKSTLMNILGCLDIPSAGSYNLNGTLVSKMRESQLATVRNKNIGLVFQNFNLLGKATAIRNVELPARYGGIGPAERHKRAVAAMTSVGLMNRLHHKPTELSGGQQQRVAIARALVNRPNILLADEPTGALDSKTGKEILDLFEQLQRENGITVIVVTHDPNVARRAHRVVTIRDGRIESDISRQPGKDGTDVLVTHQVQVIPDHVEAASVVAAEPHDTVPEEIAADQVKKKKVAFEGPIPFKRLALMGVIGVVLAIVVNIILSQLALSLLSLRSPMLQIQQVALFTVIGTALAVLVYAVVNRFAKRPIWLFRIIAAVALVLSFVPDIGLATGLFNPFTFFGGGQRGGAAAATDAGGTTTGNTTRGGGGIPGGAIRGAGGGGIGAAIGLGARATGAGTGGGFRNQSPVAVPAALIVLHIAAYGIVVGILTRQPKQKKPKAAKAHGVV
jgi:putative ABC transport system ATP-binding protein